MYQFVDFPVQILIYLFPYPDMCIALHTRLFPSVSEKNFSGGIRTHDHPAY